jgi:hypothetical protein
MTREPPFPSSFSRRGTAVAALVTVLTVASSADAVEREHHIGVDLGGSALVVQDKGTPDFGPAFGAHYAYGLTDAFNLMAEGGFSLAGLSDKPAPKTPNDRPAWLANAEFGVGYVFDVLLWVPYAGLLLGADALSGGTLDHTKILPDLVVALGVDYRLGRSLAVGVALRQHVMGTDSSTYPVFTQAFGRLEYTWGW